MKKPVTKLSYHTRKKDSEEFDRLKENSSMKKVDGPITRINPVFLIPKAIGVIRLRLNM